MGMKITSTSIGMKLLGAIGALGAATVLLISSTLAWFTVSTAPDVSKINVNVTSTQNFEIAKATDAGNTKPEEVTENDNGKETAWGQTVTFGGDGDSAIEINLPVKVDESGSIQTVSFDETSGRTNGLVSVEASSEGMQDGVAYYTYENKKCAAVMGIWLRTNTTGTISASIEGMQVSGGNTDLNPKVIGVAIKIGESGFKPINPDDGTTTEICTLDASREGTYGEIIVYLNGDNTDGNGVVAYDVGGNEPIKIEIEKIKFTNSNVQETNNQ